MPTFYNFKQDGLTYSFDDIFVKADPFRQGNLWNWGRGISGALGNYLGPNFPGTPVTTFSGGTNWKQVSTGGLHTVAIKTDGTLWVWGYNSSGQLGNGNIVSINTPITTFAGGTNWKQAEGGTAHTIAIKTDGTLWVWGVNDQGQLGTNFRSISSPFGISTPVTTFVGGTDWKQASAGYDYSAAIKTDGTLWTWGYAYFGQLGTGGFYTLVRSTPMTTFAGGTNWADTPTTNPEDLYTLNILSQGSAAIKTDGTLWIWGSGTYGVLGNADTTNRSTPVTTFAGGTNWKQVSGGGNFVAAIKTDGTLWTWGLGGSGRLGNANTTNRSTPVTTFAGGTNWKQVSAYGLFVSAIKTDGTLWTWGDGSNGKLGNANTTNRSTPVTTFSGGIDWKYVNGPFAIKTDGTLWAWGSGSGGRLGNAVTTNTSTPVTTFAGGTNWKQVHGAAAIKTDGTLWTWGPGNNGYLGNGATTGNISTPVTTFAGGTNWKQVSTSVAIKTDGTLWVWGSSENGDLANGKGSYNFNGIPNSFWIISTPITTFTGGTNWAQVNYNLALKTDGTLWTWGYNRNGQLGDGFHITINDVPRRVGSGLNWKQVSCSYHSTAAIKTDGTLWTWGYNDQGQLGTSVLYQGSADPITTFAGGTNWKQVSAGGYYSVNMMAAIKTDGTLWTWGNGINGLLGNGVTINTARISTPITTFAGGTDWKQVSCGGYHTAAVKTNGTLWTWGSNNQSALGTNDADNRSTPVTTFAGGTNWKSVGSSGGYRVCAIEYNDILTNPPDVFRLFTWGTERYGALGNAVITNTSASIPVTTFTGGTNWKQISTGGYHTAAIKTDGTLWIWGEGGIGDLGTNDISNRSTPVTTFAGGTNWKQVSSSYNYTTAIKTDGTLWAWGNNTNGQLGNARTTDTITPVTTFAGGTNWSQVGAGLDHTAAIKTDGTLWTWGRGTEGQLGTNDTTTRSTPVTTFAGGTDWKQVSSGGYHTTAIKTDGTLWIWGRGNGGQLGNNNISGFPTSTPITTFAGGTNWNQISSGKSHTAAIKTDGTLWTWGSGDYGLLGNAQLLIAATPVTTFSGGSNWKSVSCGGSSFGRHMAAIKIDGTLWAWGYTNRGKLGNTVTTNTNISTPITTFAGGTNWDQVSVGYYTSAIRKN